MGYIFLKQSQGRKEWGEEKRKKKKAAKQTGYGGEEKKNVNKK